MVPPLCIAITCAMRHVQVCLAGLFFLAAAGFIFPFDSARTAESATSPPSLHESRHAPSDLAISGELAGLPAGSTRYITRDSLLALPQMTYTVADDTNFNGQTEISGVPLEELTQVLGGVPGSDLVVAICDDQYRAHYPRAYLAAHRPLLVLKVNGQLAERWPKNAEGHGSEMGPYMISHPKFTPSFKIFGHSDEPQIPWGVVQLEFRNEREVFGAIAPRGSHAADSLVQAGYRIAQQNCFRCHNMGREGGQKAGHPWLVLSAWAAASPEYFAGYVRNPQAINPHARMPGNPGYDEPTTLALTAYFQTFSQQEKP
jgi:mono/diheme cytochrome c family protein